MSNDDDGGNNLQSPAIPLPGGGEGHVYWNGGTDPHGTVYPDGHVDGGIEGGVTGTWRFGESSSSHSAAPAPGPLDDPVSQSILRAREHMGESHVDDGFAPPPAHTDDTDGMGDYPTPDEYQPPAQDGAGDTDDSTADAYS